MDATPLAWPDGPSVEETLGERPSRPKDPSLEARLVDGLAMALADSEGNVLQKLTDSALELCGAHSAGVSLIEMDGPDRIFRWHAVSGRWSGYLMGFMPREASPCGVVVDRHAGQLMPHPELYFPAMRVADPLAEEALLVPFEVLGETVGTVWVVSHDPALRFASEDLRVIRRLSHFAAAAYFMRATLRNSIDTQEELTRANDRLKRENQRLWQQLQAAGQPSMAERA